MADLTVKIDRAQRVARFSGRGTFGAKEDIKRLGAARWSQPDKSWELRDFSIDNETLLSLFPGIEILESGEFEEPAPERVEPTAPLNTELPRGLSVSELSSRVRALLGQAFPGTIFIYGVLSNVKRVNGRVFMDLADAERPDEYLSCVIWSDEAEICKPLLKLGMKLERDLQVMFEARVDLSRKDSRLSLRIVSVVAEYTMAKLAAQRELTNKRLKEEGLFDRNKKLSLPFLPVRLGILTSAGGTVINDFRASLDEARFGFELYWLQVNVQGAGAKRQIARGLELLGRYSGLDAILLFRGGGSPAELSVFNEYDVAKAICLSPLPVISAVGHEADQSAAQDVSFRCCGVPKDIGRFFADIVRDLRLRFVQHASLVHDRSERMVGENERQLSNFVSFLSHSMERLAYHSTESLFRLTSALPALGMAVIGVERRRLEALSRPLSALGSRVLDASEQILRAKAEQVGFLSASMAAGAQAALVRLGERLRNSSNRVLQEGRHRLSRTRALELQLETFFKERESALDAYSTLFTELSPETQLKRGFALVRTADGKNFITSGSALAHDDPIEIQFHDIKRKAVVE